jgi:hypothetical protein
MGEALLAADRSIGQGCGLTIEELMVIGSSKRAPDSGAPFNAMPRSDGRAMTTSATC